MVPDIGPNPLALGPDAGPKSTGSCCRSQKYWIRTQEPRELGFDVGPMSPGPRQGLQPCPWARPNAQAGQTYCLVSPYGARVWLSAQSKPASVPCGHAGLTQCTGMATQTPGVPTWGLEPGSCPGQANPSARCSHPGPAAPPKLELTIFSPIIFSMPNASQQKDNPNLPLLPLQLSVARASLGKQ
jgi:hypothetical protein